jgi:RNA polymerase sigma factor (sigma-70 family)
MEVKSGDSLDMGRRITKKHLADLLADNSETIGKFASIFAGRGAEREDLVQEGNLALLVMLRKCSRKHTKTILRNYVKPMVRDAAAKMRRRKDIVPLLPYGDDDSGEAAVLEENLADDRAEIDIQLVELGDVLERSLTGEDLEIARGLLDGLSHKEIAEILGVSKQALSARIQRLSKTLEL